jgi:hypothetical protein
MILRRDPKALKLLSALDDAASLPIADRHILDTKGSEPARVLLDEVRNSETQQDGWRGATGSSDQ